MTEVYLFRTWPYWTAVAVRYPTRAHPKQRTARARALTEGGARTKVLALMAAS